MHRQHVVILLAAAISALVVADPAVAQRGLEQVLRELNSASEVTATSDAKSYRVVFDGWLDMVQPPMRIGEFFNHRTIHPGMRNWGQVADWAESNTTMVEALKEAKTRLVFGLPYGRENVPSRYRENDLFVSIDLQDLTRGNTFPYLRILDDIAALGTAEAYRLLEAGQIDEGLDVMLSAIWVLRQCSDRQFAEEKTRSINLLIDMLSNLRDVMYVYSGQMTAHQYHALCRNEIEWLRATRDRLQMPEGDRIVAEALLRNAFRNDGQADDRQFASLFGALQSIDAPLTRFGAARRWEYIAGIHASLDDSLARLKLVYDDWWRRWRIQEHDPLLDIPSQFERTNPVRYAAVTYAIADIEPLFTLRNVLVAQVNGTAMAAGICAYQKTFGTYPVDQFRVYAQFVRRLSDTDPFSRDYGPLRYRRLDDDRVPIDGPHGRVWIERGEAILYSRGQDLEDGRARRHSPTGLDGDILLWPPYNALARKAGILD